MLTLRFLARVKALVASQLKASLVAQWLGIHLPGLILGWEGSLKKKMATHSSVLAWEILWTEEPSEQRIRYDLETEQQPITRTGSDGKASVYNAGDPGSIPGFRRSPGEGNGNPFQYSCLENPMDRGAWWAAVYGVAKSWTRLSDFTFTLWRRKWQPTPVFLPGESQGRGSLVGYPLWGHTELDTTEAT